MEFVQNSNFFFLALFTEIISEKIVFDIVGKKRMILRGKNWIFEKGQKIDIFQRV